MFTNSDDLCVSLSEMRGVIACGPRLTLDDELVFFRGPVIIEKALKIDFLLGLFLLRPWYMTAPHLHPHKHL
jgi:hypothetical protein